MWCDQLCPLKFPRGRWCQKHINSHHTQKFLKNRNQLSIIIWIWRKCLNEQSIFHLLVNVIFGIISHFFRSPITESLLAPLQPQGRSWWMGFAASTIAFIMDPGQRLDQLDHALRLSLEYEDYVHNFIWKYHICYLLELIIFYVINSVNHTLICMTCSFCMQKLVCSNDVIVIQK